MHTDHDTIVAVSSPLGGSPRAIVRLSGPQAFQCAASVFKADHPIPDDDTYCSRRGFVAVECGSLRADVPATLLVMRGPRSYTRDDVLELHLPGNPALVAETVALVCRAGARPAAPGEFTARAFTAGRLDLAQAEAVMAVINAGGLRALSAAQRLLTGELSSQVESLVDRLRRLLARTELAIDFSDQDVPILSADEAAAEAARLRDDVVGLARRSREVTHLDGDLRVALVGRPNVGKSSLFNRLAGAERAIVTDVAGTTRDELRQTFAIDGATFVLSDTAGLADAVADLAPTDDDQRRLHAAAHRRTVDVLARAELVLVVVDAARLVSDPSSRNDVDRLLATLAAPVILVLNKCDLLPGGCDGSQADRAAELAADLAHGAPVVAVSALTGHGLETLRAAVVRTLRLGDVDRASDGPAVVARHRQCMEASAEALERAVLVCSQSDEAGGIGEELLALELREAIDALGRITGRSSPEDVLADIFAGFCIGK
ncbi:MAG: tRNA modification GTPase [Planctomycetes bacterium]|nr:tRNA modification GTPase [Planctomycetota bacterium]